MTQASQRCRAGPKTGVDKYIEAVCVEGVRGKENRLFMNQVGVDEDFPWP